MAIGDMDGIGGGPGSGRWELSDALLQSWRIRDLETARRNLKGIEATGVAPDLLNSLASQLCQLMPGASDPDRVLNNLERFIVSSRSRLGTLALLDRDRTALPILVTLFGSSQYLSDLMIRDGESYDALRLTEGQPIARQALVDEITTEVGGIESEARFMDAIRRFKRREMLRIAYGDLVANQPIQVVTRQLSYVADAVLEATVDFAWRTLEAKLGRPQGTAKPELQGGGGNSREEPPSCRFAVLALGKLGGDELNYSSDIDLIFFYEDEQLTSRGKPNREFFNRMAQEMTRWLTEHIYGGPVYRVDWRLRPEGRQGTMTVSRARALSYYENKGRSWERQAFVKARPVAGDLDFGNDLLNRLLPWIYQRRWSRLEIESMNALKRKIERRARVEGEEANNVKTGFGGIRDIEFTIQFLQLLNGATLPEVRTNNTLDAIHRLQAAGCLNRNEQSILTENYCWLRKVEHRLQIMSNLQTHTLPTDAAALSEVARRMGYSVDDSESPLKQFRDRFKQLKQLNRGILDHLLKSAFSESAASAVNSAENRAGGGARGPRQPGVATPAQSSEDDGLIPLEVDLILDQEPDADTIENVLGEHGFKAIGQAYATLNALANETIPFLSPRRCRHFLAAIARPLLVEVARTPDPDHTLVELRKVSESLGGKATLWELFRIHPPSMRLFVKLCGACRYLVDILVRHPGMLDSLIDSLTFEQLPTFEFLQDNLRELTANAEDLETIWLAFKYDQHLRVGVRDILARDGIEETHRALSDVAEILLQSVARTEFEKLVSRFGVPRRDDGVDCELCILGMGKLGGQQPNYHSDLDIVFLYDSSGWTDSRRQRLGNQQFFNLLATQIVNSLSRNGPHGRLFQADCRLRPTGKSGVLATSFEEFTRYFLEGDAQSWERLALCTARPVFGSMLTRQRAADTICRCVAARDWDAQTLRDLRAMRMRMQDNCCSSNLKRAAGGTVDCEFIVQMLQLRHGRQYPDLLQRGTQDTARLLVEHGLMPAADCEQLVTDYCFLRNVEARIRLMNAAGRHEFPDDPDLQNKLAFLLDEPSAAQLEEKTKQARERNRALFEKYFGES